MSTPDWQDMHFFNVLARTGSLSAAARELRVDHATVGRRVASLETALGLRLVDRLPRSCPLTEEGLAIAALIDEMDASAQSIMRRARSASAPLAATVRVSAPPALAAYYIAPFVGELRSAYPELKLVLQGSAHRAALERGEADIAIRLSRPQEKAAVARKIGVLKSYAYATCEHAARPPGNWEFIAFDEALDHVPQQSWLRSFLDGRPIAFAAADLFGQLAAAKAGVGVAVLPSVMGDGEPSLVRLDLDPAPPERDIWLIAFPDLRRAPAVREMIRFVTDCISRASTQNR